MKKLKKKGRCGMNKIGLLIERRSAYDRAFLRGVAEYARGREGWRPVLLGNVTNPHAGAFKGYSGFIARVTTDEMANELRTAGCPVVNMHTQHANTDFLRMDSDDARVGRCAADYFQSRYYVNFAFCGFPNLGFSDAREKAFVDRVQAFKTDCKCFVYEPSESVSENLRAAFMSERLDVVPDQAELAHWLKSLPQPVGVFCANDLRAFQLSQVCRESRLDVPRQVSILGADNDRLLCSFAFPTLTSVDVDAFRRGYAAARLLNAAMKEPPEKWRGRHEVTVGRVEVVERDSTASYAVEPTWFSDALVYIDRHLLSAFNASDVFRAVKRSHTLVDRTFKRVFGMPTHRYIVEAKMRTARKMIEEKGLPPTEVSARIGFSSVQYFLRVYEAWQKNA